MNGDSTNNMSHGDILIVEDNRPDLKFMSKTLTNAGYHVRAASDGELALRSAKARLPDLILMDFKLPGMNGVEICRHFKSNPETKDIPVIFISALGETNLKVKALEAGGSDYVTKPIEPSEVLARINTHLELYRMQKKLVHQSEQLIAENNRRKKVQERLQESEERFRLSFENANDGVCLAEKDGRVIKVNNRMCDIFGYRKKDLENMKVSDITHPGDKDISPNFIKKSLGGEIESSVFEKRYIHKKGHIIWARVSSSIIKNKKGSSLYFISHVQDITPRKQAEEELHKYKEHLEELVKERTIELENREKRYRDLFESSFDGIAESSLNGDLLTCNSAYSGMTGYSRDELKKLKYQDLTPLKWAEVDKKHVQQALDQGFSDLYEKERIHKNGTVIPISIRIWVRKDKQGKPLSLWGIVRDISKRKHAENLLVESEKRFRGIISNAEAGYFFIDTDGLFKEVNQAWLKMHKYASPEQIVGQHFSLTQIEMDIEAADENVNRIMEGEKIPSGEFSRRCKDGSIGYHNFTIAPVIHNDEVIGLEGFLIDTTKQKQAEKALVASEEKYRSILKSMKDPVYICSPDYHIEYMNPRMISRLGHNAVGEYCFKALYNRHKQCSWCVFEKIKQGEHIEYELEDPGDHRSYLISNSPVYRSEKNIGKLSIFRDITEAKQTEAQLRQARKMESIGTLAGGIAHDFNNLLYLIVGNTDLVLEDIPKWNPVYTNLEEIRSAGLRATGIVKQLLNFSHQNDPELKPIGAVSVINDELTFLRSMIPTTIEIRKMLPETEVTILADPVQINQVLMNICTNASQVMEKTGGILEIIVENITMDEDFDHGYKEMFRGNFLKVAVCDSGPGIDPEIIHRIFDPYFTTREFGKGTGMGLAVVHGIVKSLGGAISVECEPDKGTTFTVLLPVIDEKPEIETKRTGKLPLGTETILFVDDEKPIADMTGQILKRLGYKVETRLNPVEAMELFQSNPHQFDLVITDMTMPQMTGVQLSEKLKEIRPDIPVIINTGHSSLINEEKAKKMGIAAFAMKPIVKTDIAQTIRKVLDETGCTS